MTLPNDNDYERVEKFARRADTEAAGRLNLKSLTPDRTEAEDTTWLESFCLVVKRATPMIATMILFQMVQLLNIFYVGQKSSDYLAGVGLGNMLLNVIVFAVTMGLNGTLETFVAWSFGNGNYKMCGIYINRARMVVSLFLMLAILLFIWIDKVLISLG
jgi:Na+-driven multidrug efflux pump